MSRESKILKIYSEVQSPATATDRLAFPCGTPSLPGCSTLVHSQVALPKRSKTGLEFPASELISRTEIALSGAISDEDERLQCSVHPSVGGCDKFVPIFLWQKRVP